MNDYDALSTRLGDSHIFVAGDATSDLPLLHEALLRNTSHILLLGLFKVVRQ